MNNSRVRLSGTLKCYGAVQGEFSADGDPREVCRQLAEGAKHGLSGDVLYDWLTKGGLEGTVHTLSQVVVIETAAGWVVATFRPEDARTRVGRPLPSAAARTVEVDWGEPGSRSPHGPKRVDPRWWGLVRRIASRIAMSDRGYLRRYLWRAISADPYADLHKIVLRSPRYRFVRIVINNGAPRR